MAKRDLFGCAQTGTGKTAAFALPILHRLCEARPAAGAGRRIRTLVLAPTRELAAQIAENFSSYGRNAPLKIAVIYGGVSQVHQVKALRHGVDILVATPGRLLDLMDQGFVDLKQVEIFVLDEADRMLDLGFFPDIRKIAARLPEHRQTLLFSATMPGDIRSLAQSILKDPVNVHVTPVSTMADRIDQCVFHVAKRNKATLLRHLLAGTTNARSLVFTRTKRGADRVVKELERAGIRSASIHGNKSQSQRERALDGFRSNRISILVATDIAARGIDVDGISHVFNFDVPEVAENYVHRIGRTARAGASGSAICFCDPEERSYLKAIERLTRQQIAVRNDHPEYPKSDAASAGSDSSGARSEGSSEHSYERKVDDFAARRRRFVPRDRRSGSSSRSSGTHSSGAQSTGSSQGGHSQGNSGGRRSYENTQNRGGAGSRSRGRRRRGGGGKPALAATS
jgi:ATP-dependent RNA helicase RhlE